MKYYTGVVVLFVVLVVTGLLVHDHYFKYSYERDNAFDSTQYWFEEWDKYLYIDSAKASTAGTCSDTIPGSISIMIA